MNIYTIGEFDYKAPASLKEALNIIDQRIGTGTWLLAGGTDLMVQMKYRQILPSLLIDIKLIPELNRIEWSEDKGLRIGAAVPLSRILESRDLLDKYNILAQACSFIGSIQIKNRATIGGNICNAAPSADTAPALLCLGAQAILASRAGTRSVPLESYFLAPGKTVRNDNEILVEIVVPTPPPYSAGCYLRHTTREEMDITVAGVASFLKLSSQNGKLQEMRIALGAAAATPVRVPSAEAVLNGKPVTRQNIDKAADKAAEEAQPISDLRSSDEYRRELIRVLTRRTVKASCEKLGLII